MATCSYNGSVRVVGIRVLKNKLSEYVKLAAGGETVYVTDRDEIVAELGPAKRKRRRDVAETALADLIRRGVATAPKRRGPLKLKPKPVMRLEQIVAELREDRDAR